MPFFTTTLRKHFLPVPLTLHKDGGQKEFVLKLQVGPSDELDCDITLVKKPPKRAF